MNTSEECHTIEILSVPIDKYEKRFCNRKPLLVRGRVELNMQGLRRAVPKYLFQKDDND